MLIVKRLSCEPIGNRRSVRGCDRPFLSRDDRCDNGQRDHAREQAPHEPSGLAVVSRRCSFVGHSGFLGCLEKSVTSRILSLDSRWFRCIGRHLRMIDSLSSRPKANPCDFGTRHSLGENMPCGGIGSMSFKWGYEGTMNRVSFLLLPGKRQLRKSTISTITHSLRVPP